LHTSERDIKFLLKEIYDLTDGLARRTFKTRAMLIGERRRLEAHAPKRSGNNLAHNTPRGLLKGSKVTRSHTTVIDAAISAVTAAKESAHVSKIVIGVIKPTKTGQPHLKFVPIQAGLRMQVRGNRAVQIFFVYTDRPEDVILEISAKWEQR
jgi:hypothetical protein